MYDNHVGVTTISRPWPGSSLYSSRGPRTDMSRPGLEPGPPSWEASTLEKSHLDSLYAGYSEPLLMMRLASLQTSTVWTADHSVGSMKGIFLNSGCGEPLRVRRSSVGSMSGCCKAAPSFKSRLVTPHGRALPVKKKTSCDTIPFTGKVKPAWVDRTLLCTASQPSRAVHKTIQQLPSNSPPDNTKMYSIETSEKGLVYESKSNSFLAWFRS